MGSLVQLFNEWETQLLVLLSLALQMYLFFTGSLRRQSTNTFMRISIWIAYSGADLVAIYVLGLLSRHEEATIGMCASMGLHPLAFFWAPFLLIHLGGQDTITAFAVEDNKLWLRHWLDLVMQVGLALYVFWKSTGRHNVQLLVPGILLFVAGIIKYGERMLAQKYGSLENMRGFIDEEYVQKLPQLNRADGYSGMVCFSLHSAPGLRDLFAGCNLSQMQRSRVLTQLSRDERLLPKCIEIELALLYDDLYTKAVVLRTRSGIILRCISQICSMVALALFFLVSNKQRYSRADVVITYVLFMGGLFLEVCTIFIFLRSPWTWAWLEAHKYQRFSRISLSLLSSYIGWPERKPLWSNSMGQFNFLGSLSGSGQPRSCKRRAMMLIKNMMRLAGTKKENLFWINRLLDTKHIKVDNEVMESVLHGACILGEELLETSTPRQWPNLGPFLEQLQLFAAGFGNAIVLLYVFTEAHLSKYPPLDLPDSIDAAEAQEVLRMVDVCQKLSNYVLHLFVNQSEMLPISGSVQSMLEQYLQVDTTKVEVNSEQPNPAPNSVVSVFQPCKETLEEFRDLWIRLVVYIAGKSSPELHAAQLGRGGELLTFLWLHMAHYGLGDVGRRIELTNTTFFGVRQVYVFYVPEKSQQNE
ncbi:hypothetical protein ACQ4PT_025681 [Festuca glaucescens]